jgi:hypothetical protein
VRDPAEHVQGDPADGQAVRDRHEGVRQLVEQNRDEEEERGQQPVGPVGGRGQVGQRVREVPDREGPGDEPVDHEPAHVDVDRNAADREHPHRPTHVAHPPPPE